MSIDLTLNFGNSEKQAKATAKAVDGYASSASKANTSVDKLDTTQNKYTKDSVKAQSQTNKTAKSLDGLSSSAKKTNTQLSNTQKGAKNLNSGFSALAGGIGLIVGSQLVSTFVHAADTMQMVENRLKLVTKNTNELNQVQEKLFKSAQSTYSNFSDTVDLYSRLARSTEEYGYSQQQTLKVTEAITQAFVVSGSSAQEASAAVIQLGQGLASGALRGDELRSVLEQAPRLARALADGLGVSVGQLRELGSEGALTTEKVFGALLDQTEKINEEFGKMTATISQSTTMFTNSLTNLIGKLDDVSSLSSGISAVIQGWSFAFDMASESLGGFSNDLDSTASKTERIRKDYEAISKIRMSVTPLVGEGGEIDLAKEFKSSVEQSKKLREEVNSLLSGAIDPLSSKISKINKKYDEIVEKAKKINDPTQSNLEILSKINSARDAEIQKLRTRQSLLEEKRSKPTTEKAHVEDFDKRKLAEEKAFTDAIVKLNAERRDKINKFNKEIAEQAKIIDGSIYEERLKNLDAEYDALKKQGVDKKKLDIWYDEERKDILDESAKYDKKIMRASLSEWEGFWYDMLQLEKDVFVDEAANLMSDGLFGVITGDLDSMEDAWDSAWKSMLRTFTDTIAQMASEKIVGGAMDWAIDAIFAKDGLWEVEKDGQKVVAHEGEMVLPKQIATKLRKVSSESNFAALDNAIDPTSSLGESFGVSSSSGISSESAEGRALIAGLTDMRGSLVKSSAKLGSASLVGNVNMGEILNSGFGVNAFLSAAGSGATGALTSYAGMSGPFADIGGKAGSIAGALLSMAIGGPVGLMASSAAGFVGSALGDAFGDLTDARNMEVFRDYLEDKHDYFPGRSLSTGVISGAIDPASLSFADLESVIEARNAQFTADRSAGASSGFASFVAGLGSILDSLNPFSYVSPAIEYLSSLFSTPDAFDADSYNIGAVSFDLAEGMGYSTGLGGYGTKATSGYGVSDHIEQAKAYADLAERGFSIDTSKALSFLEIDISKNLKTSDLSNVGSAVASAYNAGLSTAQGKALAGFTGTDQDWSSSARTSSHSKGGYSGGGYSTGGGLGGNDFGLANGGIVSEVLAANPLDDGFAPLKLKEGVVNVPGMELLEKINNGDVAGFGGGPNQIVVQIMASSGQMLEQQVIDITKRVSERGVAVVHTKGVYVA